MAAPIRSLYRYLGHGSIELLQCCSSRQICTQRQPKVPITCHKRAATYYTGVARLSIKCNLNHKGTCLAHAHAIKRPACKHSILCRVQHNTAIACKQLLLLQRAVVCRPLHSALLVLHTSCAALQHFTVCSVAMEGPCYQLGQKQLPAGPKAGPA